METIIEIAGYVLGATVLFGTGIALFLLRAYWYQPRSVVSHPNHLKLPTAALDAVRLTLEKVKRQHHAASGAEQEELSREVIRLEARLEKLEQKTFSEQRGYSYAIKIREGAWLQWKDLHDQAALLGKRLPPDMRDLLKEAERNYVKSHRAVEEERHTAIARDMMNLEEIRGQQVLTQAMTKEPGPAAVEAAGEFTSEGEAGAGTDGAIADGAIADGAIADGAIADGAIADGAIADGAIAGNTGTEESGLTLAEFRDRQSQKSGRRYLDPYFELVGVGGVLRETDLNGCDFENVEFRGTHIYHHCNFSHANLGHISLERQERTHQFSDCDFSGAHFTQSKVHYAVFSQCDLSRTHWGGAELDHVKFVDCTMEDIFWERVDLSLTVMSQETAAQLDFSEAAAPPRTVNPPAVSAPHGAPDGNPSTASEPAPVDSGTARTED